MGKKKVFQETAEEALKASEAIESAALKGAAKSVSKKIDQGRVYIKATYNNTVITVTDVKGNAIAWATAGALGFSGPKKATPFAASKVVATVAEKLKKSGPTDVSIFVNGFGGGRDSAIRSFINQGFNVLSINDVTPLPHNGPRSPKVRRV